MAKCFNSIYSVLMNFDSVLPELLPGARNAIDTCLAR
jgi:hypothetical protein